MLPPPPPPPNRRSSMMPRRLAGLLLVLAAMALVAVGTTLFSGESPAQAQTGPTKLWESTMTAGTGSYGIGYDTGSQGFASLTPDASFRSSTHGTGASYVSRALISSDNAFVFYFNKPDGGAHSGVLCVGNRSFPFDQNDFSGTHGGHAFTNHGLTWIDDQQVELSLWEVPSKQGDWASLCAASPANETTL